MHGATIKVVQGKCLRD